MAVLLTHGIDLSDVRAVPCLLCGYRFYPEDYDSLATFRHAVDLHSEKMGHVIGWPGDQRDDW